MYLQGFGNYHQTEALDGALPLLQNSPQHCPLGLYAEQLSGTAFTQSRSSNLHSWLYRKRPSVVQGTYSLFDKQCIKPYASLQTPNPLRWSPLNSTLNKQQNFIEGLFHIAGNSLVQAYRYACNASMTNHYFSNRDGELLFVPYEGGLHLQTEFGSLTLHPGMIAVIPRGVFFKVALVGNLAKGYLCENAGSPLTLPTLGFIGANGLANPRHFNYPKAAFEDDRESTLLCKYQDKLWISKSSPSPCNVVAWQGNYAPYSYDLSLFNTINTVSFDHPDPCIYTVLTSESTMPGVANLDFVIFPPRWMVAEHTFRLPYFHRNIMSEFMGLIRGKYDAKEEGFLPGGISIHNSLTPHGPDYGSYQNHIQEKLKPEHYKDSLSFMFETKDRWQITENAIQDSSLQKDYVTCWKGY